MFFYEILRPDIVISDGIELDSPCCFSCFEGKGGLTSYKFELFSSDLPDIGSFIFIVGEVIGCGLSKIIDGEVNFIISNSQEIVI